MFSGDAATILRRYHELTGRPRRLPDWAFGVWMSRSSYFTAAEMVAVADDLAAAECPVDVMHTDEWLEEIVLNTSAWSTPPDRTRYPSGWTNQLSQRGIRTSVWINPYLAAGSDLADWAITHGFITVDGRGEPLVRRTIPTHCRWTFTHRMPGSGGRTDWLAPSPKRRLRRCSPISVRNWIRARCWRTAAAAPRAKTPTAAGMRMLSPTPASSPRR
jgi:alpha-D-xyloside xylohydrolase